MYKRKKALIVIFLLMMSFAFYGCNKMMNNNGPKDKLHLMLTTLKNYEADVTMSFLKDTEANVFKMRHQVEVGGKYKLTVESPEYLKGYTISFDGKNITEYNPSTKTNLHSQASEARNQTLLSSFVTNYLNAEDIKREKEKQDGKEVTTIEVNIPGNFKYMAKEKVWFDETKLSPLKMEIYDIEDNIAIKIEFNSFKYNTKIDFNT
ncbi:LolA family protein [Cellulosilyticum sp. I15G10I2]|uniref:LolA family protein n=1 Tax=Cellulosilyticum sp. I15G10I2 TaxID=1892843 RepID=UPI00085CDB1B|nr:outer-membrane lipoprotein carrier protein LolA [Cellulosilyticum sp. I15G10I2]